MGKSDLSKILRLKSSVFTSKEISIALGEKNRDLLKRRLNYFVKKGELIRIRRGVYAKDKNYDKFELATKILTPAYISFETVLAKEGIIFQYYNKIFVASYKSQEIESDNQIYFFRKIKDEILNNPIGIKDLGNYFIATKERAFLDILYLNKDYYFDNLVPLDLEKINSLLPIYNNKRMNKRVEALFKDLK